VPKKVIIIGGGVAGMSAAHELVERGFQVAVFERRTIPGGKARSLRVSVPQGRAPSSRAEAPDAVDSPGASKPWLPGEHGFRFFPRFYKHIVDTMERIPFEGGNVAQNLVDTTRVHVARFGRSSFYLPARFPRDVGDLQSGLHAVLALLSGNVGIPLDEALCFGAKMWQFLTSCDDRRFTEYEALSWWSFIDAPNRSEAYQRYFGHAITRCLVAAKARRASTRTIGSIFSQIVFDVLRPGVSADRVLNGPTNDVWIDPWLQYLKAKGVEYHTNADVTAIRCGPSGVQSVSVTIGDREVEVSGDYFISAAPLERMAELVSPELLAADPSLANIPALAHNVEWMNGIQFYLEEDVPIAHGHTIYLDSPWALTSVSQAQFWHRFNLTDYGDGQVRGIISVDISNWSTPGLNGKRAKDCSQQEIADEVWNQLKRSLNNGGQQLLRDEHLHSWFLDPGLVDADPSTPGLEVNLEPLLVNYVNTWGLRPDAVTRIPNFFLASDYVRTFTDLATMEGANEAARRAVNGLLNASRSGAAPCRLWRLEEPDILAPLRSYDTVRFRQGLPWDDRMTALAQSALSVATRGNGSFQRNGHGDSVPDPLQVLQESARDLMGYIEALLAIHAPTLSGVSPARLSAANPSVEAPEVGASEPEGARAD
jgi:uncharacterized protein with NAD-binding domain and iron-sulfur cluster